MPRDLDLKRRLELAGLTVIEVDGWQTRGSENFDPEGSVHHHTAGPRTGWAPSLGTVINGRPGVPGPHANVYGPREESLRVHLVAAGRANHAGRGGWQGLAGNSTVYGLEEEHHGYPTEPISALRIDRMARVHAAFAFGRFDPAKMTCQHHEWTTRKIDFCEPLLDPDLFRELVADHVRRMSDPDIPNEEDPLMALSDDEQRELLTGVRKLREESAATSLRVAKLERVIDGADQSPTNPNGVAKGTMLGRLRDAAARTEAKVDRVIRKLDA